MKEKIKALIEQRNDKLIAMDNIVNKALEETRAITDEEKGEYDKLKGEVEALGKTIELAKEEYRENLDDEGKKKEDELEEENRALGDYLRGAKQTIELRADKNFTKVGNADVVPTRIAKRIIEEVKERCNIMGIANVLYGGGKMEFPVYDESNGKIAMGYADEFSKITATSGRFITKELGGYLSALLVKVSKSLINNTDFDILSFVIAKAGEAAADWIEREELIGTEGKINGLRDVEIVSTSLSADGLIDLQDSIPAKFQKNARWIMTPACKNRIRKFKDGQGNYLLERDYSKGDGSWTLLGKPVELTQAEGFSDTDVIYGDMKGLYIKVTEGAGIDVLREQYATEHAIGVLIWLETDGDLIEPQRVKKLSASPITPVTVSPEEGTTDMWGTPVSDIQSGVEVNGNAITGTLKYLTTGALARDWGEGNFIALKFGDIYSGATSVKVGLSPSEGSGLVELDEDKNGVFKVTNKSVQKFKVVTTDGTYTNTQLFDLSGLTVENG